MKATVRLCEESPHANRTNSCPASVIYLIGQFGDSSPRAHNRCCLHQQIGLAHVAAFAVLPENATSSCSSCVCNTRKHITTESVKLCQPKTELQQQQHHEIIKGTLTTVGVRTRTKYPKLRNEKQGILHLPRPPMWLPH
ncbi:unnamed protein product [Ceratitis capitata]|uniref:(Mediterranean fruit fly) hypothetical protein n=1 Tax=Ceratitis capitata TaxID=7213 RepID=A0A811UW42_CERCA|nr:unnamed protein product [Ceratitis capitata]